MMNDRLPRKLAAILYADVTEYSRLTGDDEDATHRTLSEYLDLISQTIEYDRGQVMHYAGDAVLAKFDAVVDAVSSAVEIQKLLAERNEGLTDERKVKFRIGVNLGDVIEDRGDIYGDGVNIAARLESLSDPGGICVSDSVRTAIGKKLNLDFEFMGDKRVKNIAEPLRAYRVLNKCSVANQLHAPTRGIDDPQPQTKGQTQKSSRPAVVVLPFINLSDDPAHGYFVDGFTEDLITELSRFKTLTVIARTSAFVFKDQSLSVSEIADKLGVNFVLEGSIRKMGGKFRVTAQLIECEHGGHVWADRYDCQLEEIFAIQDVLISEIVGTLENRIVETRLNDIGLVPPQTLEAYDSWLQGTKLMREWRAEADEQSVELFERSISLDPNFARPYAGLAGIYSSRCLLLPGQLDLSSDMRLAAKYARKAVELDPFDANVHRFIGWVHMVEREFDQAENAFYKAMKLNPNDADIAIAWALISAFLGNVDVGIETAKGAVERNPFHPEYYLGYQAIIQSLAERYTTSLALFDRMTLIAPPDFWGWYAAASFHAGRTDSARWAAESFINEVGKLWVGNPDEGPEEYVTWFLEITPLKRDEDVDWLISGLKGAGLPYLANNRI